jgi:regulator of sigma E protease
VKGCRAATPVQIVVKRDGKLVHLTITPIYDPAAGKTRLGFAYSPGGPRSHFSVGHGLNATGAVYWDVTKQVLRLPVVLFNAHQRKQLSTVVGISDVAHQGIAADPGEAVYFAAVISLVLAIMNLFPFLPLDGGHIFWAIVEKVRRQPVPYSVMERAGVVGFMLVIFLFLIGITNDIGRLTNGGFNVK